MRKLIFFTVILLMIPAMTAMGMTTSPPAVINGNDLISVSATAATIVHPNVIAMDTAANVTFTFDVNAGADLISANAQIASAQITEEVATTAKIEDNGKSVDGANITVTRNADTAQINGTFTTIAIILPVTDSNYIEGSINTYGTTLTNGSDGADAQWFNSEVAYVLKIEISAGANIDNNCLAESVESTRTLSDNVNLSGLAAATLKMPINLVANTYYAHSTAMAQNPEGRAYANELAGVVSENANPLTDMSMEHDFGAAGLAMNFC
ncbi:MAG: hypothetical protein PHR36_05480 [Patescibacteria group bacterium]|nr:hypothetical protein [Patescibacteria group bacterium]